MRTLICLRGLPASGKSSWSRDQIAKEPCRWRRVNRDDLRAMMNPPVWSRESEELIVAAQDKIIREALSAGYDVIVDNCHVTTASMKQLYKLAEEIGDITVLEKAFNTSAKECLVRNSKREGRERVPDKVITDMSYKARHGWSDKSTYFPPKAASCEPIVQDESLPKAIMCDLDGTLAIIGNRSPYDASKCDEVDKPNVPVIECVKSMYKQGYAIIFMSGREDKDRAATERFIEKWCQILPLFGGDVMTLPHQLYMRVTGDKRKDAIVKRELFDAHVAGKHYVQFVLDDRNSVCDFWRSIGLACFQVNYGDF